MLLDLRGMTRKELADGAGVTEVAIGRYITGKRAPRAVTVAAIADVLNVSVDELLDREPIQEDELRHAARLVARNAGDLSADEKKRIVDALLGI